MKKQNNTIVYFHTGRGGRFHNAGHVTFCGEKNINELVNLCSDNLFSSYEDLRDCYKKIKGRENLEALYNRCADADDFSEFEKRTGLEVGERCYTDCNGNVIITEAEMADGTGTLNWDNEYDTDRCIFLRDCEKRELLIIIESREWNRESLVQEFFDECTDEVIDWKKFNGDYSNLIAEYFDAHNFSAAEFYEEEEAE